MLKTRSCPLHPLLLGQESISTYYASFMKFQMWFFLTSFAHKYGSWGWQTTDLAASFFLSAWPSCFLNWIMVSCAWRQNQRLEQFKRKKSTGWFRTPVKKALNAQSPFLSTLWQRFKPLFSLCPNKAESLLQSSRLRIISAPGNSPAAFCGSVLVILRPKRHKLDMSWTLSLQCLAGTTQNLQSCQACMFWYDLCHLCQQLPDFGFGTWDVKPWSAKTSSQCSFFFLVACCRVCSVFSTRFAAASVTACQSSPATMNFSWNSELFSQTWHHLGVSKIWGIPKWMVVMETPIKMDDLGYHHLRKPPSKLISVTFVEFIGGPSASSSVIMLFCLKNLTTPLWYAQAPKSLYHASIFTLQIMTWSTQILTCPLSNVKNEKWYLCPVLIFFLTWTW